MSDYGSCVQIAVNLAKTDGVSIDLIKTILDEKYE